MPRGGALWIERRVINGELQARHRHESKRSRAVWLKDSQAVRYRIALHTPAPESVNIWPAMGMNSQA